MDTRLINIQVLIWDFDGTLYKPHPDLWRDVREAEYRVIAEHTGWEKEKVIEEFTKLYKVVLASATQVVAKLAEIQVKQAAIEMENYYDRTKYLRPDDKLVELFTKLAHLKHYLLVNGIQKKIVEALAVLGLSESLFAEIVTSETVGDNKPSPKGFLYILEKTGLSLEQHLMIGDRIDVDLEPAKKIGMKTCLVWSVTSHPSVDVTIPTVYDVANLVG